jgi:hypothetical protein
VNHNINPALQDLALPVELLEPLPGNPRIGNVDAIAASYKEFGQVKPIVVKAQPDGTYVVVAGNHQLQAVKRLGWSHVAAVQMDGDDQRAAAFALVDNRVADLGRTDPALLHDILSTVNEEFLELFEAVGWDEYEVASIGTDLEELYSSINGNGAAGAYIPPVLMDPVMPMGVETRDDGTKQYTAPPASDQRATAAQGAAAAGSSGGGKQAVFSFSLVFDDNAQMSRWWDFVKWLRASPAYDGDTIASKVMSFIDAHSEV